MLTVAIIARKGGAGKTTLALHLAVEAAKTGPVVLIDTDPQASAAQWADGRQAPQPAVVACPAARLEQSLQAARRSGAHIAFIDTAPAVETPALAAARAADFCLIVSRPGILDLQSIGINVQIAKLAGKPVALVMNAAHARDGQAIAAGENAGTSYSVEVCPIMTGSLIVPAWQPRRCDFRPRRQAGRAEHAISSKRRQQRGANTAAIGKTSDQL